MSVEAVLLPLGLRLAVRCPPPSDLCLPLARDPADLVAADRGGGDPTAPFVPLRRWFCLRYDWESRAAAGLPVVYDWDERR